MPKSRNTGQFGCPTYNQAQKIVARFGGEAKLAALIKISRISVYRWQYRRPYGSDGLIPTAQIEKIRSIARLEGILLRDEDWVPQVVKYDEATRQHKETRARKSLADLLA